MFSITNCWLGNTSIFNDFFESCWCTDIYTNTFLSLQSFHKSIHVNISQHEINILIHVSFYKSMYFTCQDSKTCLGSVTLMISQSLYANILENSFYRNIIPCNQITTEFCTWQDSIAVMSCAKFCSDHLTRIWMTAKQIFCSNYARNSFCNIIPRRLHYTDSCLN